MQRAAMTAARFVLRDRVRAISSLPASRRASAADAALADAAPVPADAAAEPQAVRRPVAVQADAPVAAPVDAAAGTPEDASAAAVPVDVPPVVAEP
jgi:hypothetical protein